MFSKIKSVFKGQENPETVPLMHPNVEGSDVSQCPFMKKNGNKHETQQKKKNVKGKNNSTSSDQESQEQQKPRGGCPFMNGGGLKKNPNLGIENERGFDQPFISKFKYYLSDSKINFSAIRKGKRNFNYSRENFDKYPIYLKHTLFYNGQDFKKIRGFQCCSRFMAYDQLRERGNKFFNKGKYLKALDFYERSMSMFRWLQYDEIMENSTKNSCDLSLNEISSQSQIGSEEVMGSKIKFNFQQNQSSSADIESKDQQFDQFEEKYKEFFVVYHDQNVKYHNGEEMEEKPDIDMRNSLLLQIYLNMAAAYIKLNHYSLAHRVLNDALSISDRVSQVYLRKAQATLYNNNSTLQDLRIAQINILKAIEMQPNEKIFQNTNPNILKMINIHDAKQVYQNVADRVAQRINQISEKFNNLKESIQNRLKHIKSIEESMIREGKTPQEGKQVELMSQAQEYKILQRIYSKYVRILQFFSQTKDKQQLKLAKKQFQQVLSILAQIDYVEKIQVDSYNMEFGSDEEKIRRRINRIKRQKCEEIYNSGKYNFQVLEWAIKQVIDEQFEQKKRREQSAKKQVQEARKARNLEYKDTFKQKMLRSLPFTMIVVPIIGVAINYLIL